MGKVELIILWDQRTKHKDAFMIYSWVEPAKNITQSVWQPLKQCKIWEAKKEMDYGLHSMECNQNNKRFLVCTLKRILH